MAAHDGKPGGASGVHFDAAIQHAQTQHMRRGGRTADREDEKGTRRGEEV